MVSPLIGPAGNVEFVLHAQKGAAAAGIPDVHLLLSDVVNEAVSRRDAAGGT
jgi:hypothetical protein